MDTMTKHRDGCARVFKRYDSTCARCHELAQGATARRGWGDRTREWEAQTLRAIRAHDFRACAQRNGCCTHFDW
jgi:hypothetical protein